MPENKVGDDVLVKGKIEEVRETARGKRYLIRVEKGSALFETVIVEGSAIVE